MKQSTTIRFPYDGALVPLLQRVAFIRADIDAIKKEYVKWTEEHNIQNLTLSVESTDGDLRTNAMRLLPFEDRTKVLLMPTNSDWIVYTDNRSGAEKAGVIAGRLNVEWLDVCAIYNQFGRTANGWGGGWISVNRGRDLIRHVGLTWQEHWEFEQFGDPLPFENPSDYTHKFQRDRFTPEMFIRYCKHYGIDFFNEDFYFPPGKKGVLIRDVYNVPFRGKTKSLEEARIHYGL